MKTKLSVLIIVAALYGCKQDKTSLGDTKSASLSKGYESSRLNSSDINVLKKSLKTDDVFRKYSKYSEQFRLDVASGKYSLDQFDEVHFEKNISKVKNLNDLADLYRKSGISNAKDYTVSYMRQKGYRSKLFRKYPQLKNLTAKERTEIFSSLSNTTTEGRVEKYYQVYKNKVNDGQ
ncbi:hypothetical protein EIM50_16540 [Pseudoxanthomonas sp. SGD-10]|nr:hypothetical protein EIM50_16540 [Pseudoxanthomonas sp. SGD-10]